jgi:glycerol-3-phosphate O-acyltransferase/dihydroxyacetone phosphate acyltransferase
MDGSGNQAKETTTLVPWIYDIGLWIFTLCLDIFFREIFPRGAWRILKDKPVIIVAGPHANQFVDSIVLMQVLKSYVNRRVSFLIAEKSMKEPCTGTLVGYYGSLPVARAMDNIKPGVGRLYLPDVDHPCIVGGIDTDFTSSQFMIGGHWCYLELERKVPARQQ